MRMSVLLDQWRIGHVIPVWSTALQYDYGSPLPILYHKTFTYMSAAVLGITGNVKAALVIPVFVCMVAGFCGMCFSLRQALRGRHPWIWMLGGALLMSSNYAFTDWLVRGALAEFSALALMPWVFAWCLKLIMDGRWSLWIGPLLALLALSHSTLGLFVSIPLALAIGVAAWQWRGAAMAWLRPGLLSAGIALLAIAPFALPMLAMGRFNRIEELVRYPGFTPMTNVFTWVHFLWDHQWAWGERWDAFTLQIDPALLVLLPLYLAMAFLRKTTGYCLATAMFLSGVLAAMAWLQTRSALWVYETVPGTVYLQFPWRLVAYGSVAMVMCACLALSHGVSASEASSRPSSNYRAVVLLAILTLAAVAAPKMWWHPIRYEWYSDHLLQDDLTSEYAAMGEFFPLVDWQPSNDINSVLEQMRSYLSVPHRQGCTVVATNGSVPRERSHGSWRVICPAPAVVSLDLFAAPGMAVRVRRFGSSDWTAVPVRRTCDDPRLQVTLKEGSSEIDLAFPNWWRTVRTVVVRQGFDFRRDCILPPAARRIAGHSGMH